MLAYGNYTNICNTDYNHLELATILVLWISGFAMVLAGAHHRDKETDKKTEKVFTSEYEVELINQDSIVIRSIDNGKIYYCKPEDIDSILIKDNL
jgi:hypothetical protein